MFDKKRAAAEAASQVSTGVLQGFGFAVGTATAALAGAAILVTAAHPIAIAAVGAGAVGLLKARKKVAERKAMAEAGGQLVEPMAHGQTTGVSSRAWQSLQSRIRGA